MAGDRGLYLSLSSGMRRHEFHRNCRRHRVDFRPLFRIYAEPQSSGLVFSRGDYPQALMAEFFLLVKYQQAER
jgi:hypothetical protein